MIVFLFLLFFTPSSVSSKELSQLLHKTDKTESSISVHLESEGRLSKNQISKNQNELYPYIPYTDLGFHYSKNDNLNFLINLGAESYKNDWQMGLGEFSFSYTFEIVPLSMKAGWLPLPLGYKEKNANVFSQDLYLYSFLTLNHEDIGLMADVYIWKNILSLQVSYFRSWSYRESDDSYKAPESTPFIVSVKSRGFFWDIFISLFEKDLAFFDPLQALGAGVELKTDYEKLTVSVQSEFWRIKEKGQTTFAYYVFPNLSIYKLQVGMIFGDVNKFSPDFKTAQVKSSIYEKALQLAYQIHPNVVIIGDHFIRKQKKGLLINDLWAARIKVQFNWSKDF